MENTSLFNFHEDCVCTMKIVINKSFSRKMNLFCVKISLTFSKRDENYEFIKMDNAVSHFWDKYQGP